MANVSSEPGHAGAVSIHHVDISIVPVPSGNERDTLDVGRPSVEHILSVVVGEAGHAGAVDVNCVDIKFPSRRDTNAMRWLAGPLFPFDVADQRQGSQAH